MKKKFLLLIILFAVIFISNSQEKFIVNWLKTEEIKLQYPCFADKKNVKEEKFSEKDMFKFSYFDISKISPKEKDIFKWNKEKSFEWKKVKTDKKNFLEIDREEENGILYLVSYLNAERWLSFNLKIETSQMCEIFIDGEKVASKYTQEKDGGKIGNLSKKLKLEKGNHILIVKTLNGIEKKLDWKLKTSITLDKDFKEEDLNFSLSPKNIMNIHNILDGKKISSAKTSSDGKFLAISYRNTCPKSKKTTYSVCIKNTETKKNRNFFENISHLKWSPQGHKISYIRFFDKKANIYLFDLDAGKKEILLENVENFMNYYWSKDGIFIIYKISEKADKNKIGLKKLINLKDRQSWWRNRSFLYKLDVETKVKQRLTYGNLSSDFQDISHNGKYILFSQNSINYSDIPYSQQNLYLLDLENLKLDTIWKNKNFSAEVSFSPDDKKLLVMGSPSVFGKIGENIKENQVSNSYDEQAYIYDLKTKKVDAITYDFNPSIKKGVWVKDNFIYFLASDETYVKLFEYDIVAKVFNNVQTGVDVISNVDFAKNSPFIVYTGTSISTYKKAYTLNLYNKKYKIFEDTEFENYKNVVFGKTENWNFENKDKITIKGRIYYPANFDKSKKYPLIVYYYGGTSPVDRSFGGRYPKNLFAGQGYIVYVLQPSGATGFGQEFSAKHVNNWGITVADEIINGVKKFTEEHKFIDSKKIGCMGASYGGFMTMLLQTRTDIFAAAISHAGISSISSYWGEGYWGYAYSTVASANSFPWNNKDLYVGQSPLFNADKIKTPLLLLHGKSDTNVPVGESIQLYTALKILGKDVELIEIDAENHHITDYKKRIYWNNTIIAYFDKYLKNQDNWWKELYKEDNF